MPSNLQDHRQVPLSNTEISGETKNIFYKLLQKYDAIISKIDNNIGQTDLIEMHIATRLDAAPFAVWPYPLALKHHKFFEERNQTLVRCMNYSQNPVPMGKPYCHSEETYTWRFATVVLLVYWL